MRRRLGPVGPVFNSQLSRVAKIVCPSDLTYWGFDRRCGEERLANRALSHHKAHWWRSAHL